MTHVSFEGVTLDSRTCDMFVRLRWKLSIPLVLTQGSYNAGGVGASAGTHDGGGVFDIRARDLSTADRYRTVLVARQLGFAAWLRTPAQSDWPYHIHAVAIGCPDLAPSAARQVTAYKNGRNGLANNGPDDGPRGYQDVTWESYNAAHPDEEWEMTVGDQILAEVKAVRSELGSFVKTEAGRYNVDANRYKDLRAAIQSAIDAANSDEPAELAAQRYADLKTALLRVEEDVQPQA
jgi:hypothetical protein